MSKLAFNIETDLPPNLGSDAPDWLARVVAAELPKTLRANAVRLALYFAVYHIMAGDEDRAAAEKGIARAIEAFSKILAVLDPDRSVEGVNQNALAWTRAVTSQYREELRLISGLKTLAEDKLKALNGHAADPASVFSDIIHYTYAEFHTSAMAILEAMNAALDEDRQSRMTNNLNSQEQATEAANQIETVSKRIRLISINAAIEAARAGDTGKSFAVIAQEVKALAEETGDASRAVRDQMDTLRGSIDY